MDHDGRTINMTYTLFIDQVEFDKTRLKRERERNWLSEDLICEVWQNQLLITSAESSFHVIQMINFPCIVTLRVKKGFRAQSWLRKGLCRMSLKFCSWGERGRLFFMAFSYSLLMNMGRFYWIIFQSGLWQQNIEGEIS